METAIEDPGLDHGPTLTSSWVAACGSLTQSLLTRIGPGAQDLNFEQLLAPPALGSDLVSLKNNLSPRDENPCFLYLKCGPNGGEEILSVGILSSARNMEVYLGEEYCGTSRGKNVCTALDDSEHEKILLYKKFLKLESPTHACKIKLLSFGEKQCVLISKVVVHVRPRSANPSPSSSALGSRIDLDSIQTIMESMGSKLSPGAQQLMNMIRFQQQAKVAVGTVCGNRLPIGDQLQSVLGTTGHKHLIALQSSPSSGVVDKASSTPFPFRTGLTPSAITENLKALIDKGTQPPGEGNTTNHDECHLVPQNHSLLENDLKNAVSSFLPKKASGNSNVPNSELLPFLQNLCSQVNHLRVGHNARWQENISKPRESIVGVSYHSEVDSCSISTPFWDNPERHQPRKIFTVGRTLSSTCGHTFCVEGEMARCVIVHHC
ncbi:hypothetical protein H671_3g8683 [Cricetulus griseus]|uniref:Uncharacterized protein n=1 Tax=Cricetulus griseus TaxID=10029 RepID=A0A061IHZ2_CRIGR|nr:hypothetical protein H671_3g8683 [Cricetulus griseus]